MYYPYFRGKQFELIAIRESAELISNSGFVPIIEPVRESLTGLEKTLKELTEEDAQSVVVINPRYGDHRDNGGQISALLEKEYRGNEAIQAGILLTSDVSTDKALQLISEHRADGITLIHSGFTDSRHLSQRLVEESVTYRNVFLEAHTNLLYRRHFKGGPRILVGDGFVQMKNADYQPVDAFSDLHITYKEQGMDGFGDFLTVGDNYNEGGGPAYAVAIHLTFIDPDQDDAMFVYHFKSDSNDTPIDPGGKFFQALEKLILKLDTENSHLFDTSAIREFRHLYDEEHFPGLGYVKKLSIKHHLETLSRFLEK